MRVLVIEDNRQTAQFVSSGLKQAGHVVQSAYDGNSGLALAAHGAFDAVILDLMLPDMEGLTVLDRLHAASATSSIPVLILSARGMPSERIAGLERGADDYLPKPFLMDELIARLNAITRRCRSAAHDTVLAAGKLSMNTVERWVCMDGVPVALTALEFKLLECLLRNRRRIMTKAVLLSRVWGYSFDPQTNVIEARICKLREKLHGSDVQIRNVKGFGYVID